MGLLKDVWTSISETGTVEGMDERLKRKVKLTNQIAFVACVSTTLQMFMYPHIQGYTLLSVGCILAYATTWWLNDRKLWNASRLYFCIAACICISISGSLLSDEPNIAFRLIMLQAFVLPLVVFDITETRYLTFGFTVFIVMMIVMDQLNASIPMLEGIDSSNFQDPITIMVNSILCMVCLFLGYRYLQKLNFQAECKLAESLVLSENQRQIIAKKNEDIQSGISYAQQIQKAVLPDPEDIRVCLPDHFIMYEPKEQIGGDFFWYGEYENHLVFAAVDCTGHGTPGALISIIGSKLLDKIVREHGVVVPSEILELLNLDIISTLRSEYRVVKDGLDISLVSIDIQNQKLTYAGAKNPLVVIRDGELVRIKGDRASIGETHILEDGFTDHEIPVRSKDGIYLFSDGIIDQFGGPENRKLMNQGLAKMLLKDHMYSMDIQHECLKKDLKNWQGQEEQVDDLLVIGFRVDFEHISSVMKFRRNAGGYSSSNTHAKAS